MCNNVVSHTTKRQLIKRFFAVFLRVFIHYGFFENHLLGIYISNTTITEPP